MVLYMYMCVSHSTKLTISLCLFTLIHKVVIHISILECLELFRLKVQEFLHTFAVVAQHGGIGLFPTITLENGLLLFRMMGLFIMGRYQAYKTLCRIPWNYMKMPPIAIQDLVYLHLYGKIKFHSKLNIRQIILLFASKLMLCPTRSTNSCKCSKYWCKPSCVTSW